VKAVLAKSYTGVNDSVHLQDADIDPAWRSLRKLAMPDLCLEGRRILVAEDEYLIAFDVRDALVHAGAEVLGPVPSVDDAAALLERETDIDAAVLDVNLRGDMVFAVAAEFRSSLRQATPRTACPNGSPARRGWRSRWKAAKSPTCWSLC
jgi:hypothetical protein